MARASTDTKMPLDRWAALLGINPLHFAGVQLAGTGGSPNLQTGTCQQAWFRYNWQDVDRVGWEEVAEAIREAEDKIEAALHWRLVPAWEEAEWANLPRPWRPEMMNYSMTDLRGMPLAVEPEWHKLLMPGVRATTRLAAATAIVYSDTDGDQYKETATVTIAAGTLTDVNEIVLVYPGKDLTGEWIIRPAHVALTGGNFVITFRRELALLTALSEKFGAKAIDGMVDADFLATIDVWRVYNDPSTQAVLMWEPGAGCACDCIETGGCPACEIQTQAACMTVRGTLQDGRWALTPATWDPDTETFTRAVLLNCRAPDSVQLNYRAGDPAYASKWERAVAYYAMALLNRNPCNCTVDSFRYWREDLAFAGGQNQETHFVPDERDLSNPFGSRRGMVHAWRAVRENGAAVNPAGILVR